VIPKKNIAGLREACMHKNPAERNFVTPYLNKEKPSKKANKLSLIRLFIPC
jgi:hypothetical protein